MPPKNDISNNTSANPQMAPFELVVDKLKNSSNVLVTVSANPSLDQLSACIGLTIVLNKIGKHATAVFSGKIPSAIEFLKPEKTIEKNTDSLRDFIISLDKSKADKLRYKVEDDVVKIFITPYKTSISEKDLQFSQGDFNVDAVVAIGVKDRSHLDAAITAHGRILHDATVMCVNTKSKSEFAAIDWVETRASSLCEMAADIVLAIKREALDAQVSTSLLTGIVAETDRFRNERVSPHTMSVSGVLMASGASTQLVATKLEDARKSEVVEKEPSRRKDVKPSDVDDGTIRIKHNPEPKEEAKIEEPEEQREITEVKINPEEQDNIRIDDQGTLRVLAEDRGYLQEKPEEKPKTQESRSSSMALDPPRFGGQLTANSVPQDRVYSGSTDPLSAAPKPSMIHDGASSADNKPLDKTEDGANSPHSDIDQARQRAQDAANAVDPRPTANQSMGSQNVELNDRVDEDIDKTVGPPPPVPPPMLPPTS